MASGPHTFAILGVFSANPFHGNRLPIVAVRGHALSPQKRRSIAQEFGCATTVFIYDASGPGLPRRVEILSETGEELTFSGHSVLGVAHYLFNCVEGVTSDGDKPLTTVLMTQAGPVPVLYSPGRQVTACSVSCNFHMHKARLDFDHVLDVQPQVQIVPTMGHCKGMESSIVSISKGVSFVLVDLTEAPEILSALRPSKTISAALDTSRASDLVCEMYFVRRRALVQRDEPAIQSIQARSFARGREDPGSGSACSALACYLATHKDLTAETTPHTADLEGGEATMQAGAVTDGNVGKFVQKQVYAIQQGVEMGRGCTIAVEIDVEIQSDQARRIDRVTLSGRSTVFAKGELMRV